MYANWRPCQHFAGPSRGRNVALECAAVVDSSFLLQRRTLYLCRRQCIDKVTKRGIATSG